MSERNCTKEPNYMVRDQTAGEIGKVRVNNKLVRELKLDEDAPSVPVGKFGSATNKADDIKTTDLHEVAAPASPTKPRLSAGQPGFDGDSESKVYICRL